MPRKYKDLSEPEKRSVLIDCLIDDGADVDTAYDTAQTDKTPDQTLRNVFGYTDDTEVT
jgi:hypothetical protein